MNELTNKLIERLTESSKTVKTAITEIECLSLKDAVDIVNEVVGKGGWIPCSERLPNKEEFLKDDGRFIVTDGNRRYQSIYDIYEGGFRTLKMDLYNGWEFKEDNCVIAWQPLPTPYEPGE